MYFLFGKKIGTILYVILAVIFAGMYGASSTIFGLDGFIAMDKTQILLIVIPAAFILFALSCLLSIQIYKKDTPDILRSEQAVL